MRVVDSLDVLVAHVAMMPWWVMLDEVVGQVEPAQGRDEIELALVDIDSVLHPPVAHVERLGKFLSHFGSEDALGRTVVSLEGGAGDALRVAKFYESCAHWTCVFATHIDAFGFGFRC